MLTKMSGTATDTPYLTTWSTWNLIGKTKHREKKNLCSKTVKQCPLKEKKSIILYLIKTPEVANTFEIALFCLSVWPTLQRPERRHLRR